MSLYEYRARANKVVDGDTLHLNVDLGMDTTVNLTVRLYGLNAPEMGTATGIQAREFVLDWLAQHAPSGRFLLRTIKDRREKYGRYLGVILSEDGQAVLNDMLLQTGHAAEYLP